MTNSCSSKRNVSTGNKDQSLPGSELFPTAGSSYVPFGMTPEEYAKIKKKESEKLKKMDFASWGPRFAISERPEGDWMVMPSLWTSGYERNTQMTNGSSNAGNLPSQQSLPNGKMSASILVMKQLVPIYLLAFLSIELLSTSAYFVMKKKFPQSIIAVSAMQLIKRSSDIARVSSILWSKTTFLKIVLATTLVKPFTIGIDTCYRRFLWSPRRTISFSAFAFSALAMISVLFGRLFTG